MDPRAFLAAVRARLRRVILLDGGARVVRLALLSLFALFLIDWQADLPGVVRLAALLGVAVAIGVVARRRLLRPLRVAMDEKSLASFVERRRPELSGRLISEVEGIALGSDFDALKQTLAATPVLSLAPAARLPRRLGTAGLCVAASLGLLALAAAGPGPARDGLLRLLLPLSGHEWTRSSVLSAKLARPVVAADETLVIEAERLAGEESPLVLHWTDPATGRAETRQLPGLKGPWRQPLALPPGRHRLEVHSGDAHPVVLEGRVVARPALLAVSATVTPPAYLGEEPQSLDTLTLAALPGATVAFSLTMDRPLVAYSATVGDLPLALSRTGMALAGNLAIKRSAVVELGGADADGIIMAPTPRFNITAAEDRVPVVSISGPIRGEAVTVAATLALRIAAEDDHGLERLVLSATAVPPRQADGATQPSRARTLAEFAAIGGARSTVRTYELKIDGVAVAGETVEVIAEAADRNDVSGPGIGRSEPLLLKVVTPEELRQELDRLLGEARDRVVQAREEVAAGLAKPETLERSARSAGLSAGRADTALLQVLRRWRENSFEAERIVPAAEAQALLAGEVAAGLAATGDAPARAAEGALGKAERLLASLLSEGDLTRLLSSLIAKQTSLGDESRTLVKEYLTKPMDAAGRARQANLVERQAEIATQVKEVERRLLAGTLPALKPAQDLARSEGPGDRLAQAAGDLGSTDRRAGALEGQKTGLEALKRILEALRGSDAAGDLGQALGELAAAQERLAGALEAGAKPQSQAAPQEQLETRTRAVQGDVTSKDPEAGKLVAAAVAAQSAAGKAMGEGDRAAAAREAAAAAAMLREAQRRMDPRQAEEEKNKKKSTDLLAILKELHGLQATLAAEASALHARLADAEPDFAAQRTLGTLSQSQADILLRLREEVLAQLSKNPIALMAGKRVEAAMARTEAHLARPALGTAGMRLAKIALAELTRLLEMAEQQGTPDKEPEKGGGGGGGGQDSQVVFPVEAELALLAGLQDELAALTAANRPVGLAVQQGALRDLATGLTQRLRPGTRPHLLLSRSQRAMAVATELLSRDDRGLDTRHEQEVAGDAIRRLLAELPRQGGGGSGDQDDKKPKPDQQPQGGSPPPAGQPSPGGGAAAGGGQQAGPKQGAGGGGVVVRPDNRDDSLLGLPPEQREQLRQARQELTSPRAIQLYQRYLELLSEGK